MRNSEVPEDKPIRGGQEKRKERPKKPANVPLLLGMLAALVLGPIAMFGVGLLIGPEDTLKLSGVIGTVLIFGGVFWIRIIAVVETESATASLNPIMLFVALGAALNDPKQFLPAFALIGLGIAVYIVGFFFAVGVAAVSAGA
jgi:hypothetical protein